MWSGKREIIFSLNLFSNQFQIRGEIKWKVSGSAGAKEGVFSCKCLLKTRKQAYDEETHTSNSNNHHSVHAEECSIEKLLFKFQDRKQIKANFYIRSLKIPMKELSFFWSVKQ